MSKKRTEEKDTMFFEALANGLTAPAAASAAGYARSTVYYFRKNHKDFSRRWKLSVSLFENKLLKEVDRRAVTGIQKPVYYKGKVVGSITEYSDQLLMFRLRTLKDKYNPSSNKKEKENKIDNEKSQSSDIVVNFISQDGENST